MPAAGALGEALEGAAAKVGAGAGDLGACATAVAVAAEEDRVVALMLTRTMFRPELFGLFRPQPGFSYPHRNALLQEETGGPGGRRDCVDRGPWSVGEFRSRRRGP